MSDHELKVSFEDKSQKSYFWLGMPCKFSDDPDLAFLPENSDGGRALALPSEATRQELFDNTMPLLAQVHMQGKQQSMMQGGISPLVPLVQGIHVVWVFAANEINELRTRVKHLEDKIEVLEKQLVQVLGGT